MINVSVTTVCNRRCGYCFAPPHPTAQMTMESFERALHLVERSGGGQFRMMGGEPTLHPAFPDMVDRVLERRLQLIVFSNGLMPETALRHLARVDHESLAVLVNTPSPDDATESEHRWRAETLRRLGNRVTLGLNIDRPSVRLEFLLELIRECNLARAVRLGLAHPRWGGENRFLHPRHYVRVGRMIADFWDRAAAEGVRVDFDCGFVPCMFPAGWDGLATALFVCAPVPDVLPDGTVTSCYPLSGVCADTGSNGRGAASLRAGFRRRLSGLRELGVYLDCLRCDWRRDGRCQGGCLASALRRLRPAGRSGLPAPRGES